MGKKLLLCFNVLLCAIAIAQSPDQSSAPVIHTVIPVLPHIQSRLQYLNTRLEQHAHKYLQKLERKEAALKRKFMKIDSVTAKQLFEGTAQQYARSSASLTNASGATGRAAGAYLPNVDSLKSSLSFLQQNKALLSGEEAKKVTSSLQQLQQMQGKLQQADAAKAFIQYRKQQIKEVLSRYTQLPKSITQTYQRYNKDLYYYSTQVQEYKDMLNDPDKMFTKALSLLNKLPAFQSFLQQHSELAGLFAVPASYGAGQSLAGMQTRNDVQLLMQAQYASAGPNVNQMLQQNMQAAQAQLNQLKDRINKLGSAGAEMDMPISNPITRKQEPSGNDWNTVPTCKRRRPATTIPPHQILVFQ